jgi:hypothetical protein
VKVTKLIILLTVLCSSVRAQLVIDEIPRGMYYDRTARVRKFKDMKNMRDVFHHDGFLLGRNRITGSISNNFGRLIVPENGRDVKRFRSTMCYFIRFRFFEEYSVNLTFFQDLNKAATAPWSPHLNYTIGRYQWRPRKFNYGYENYLPNRFDKPETDWKNKFLQGYYYVAYSHGLPDSIRKYTQKVDSTFDIKFTYFARYYINYNGSDVTGNVTDVHHSKQVVGISMRYSFTHRLFFEFAPQFHFNKNKQMPWDPDFTYGFGYSNYQAFRVSASYANYGPNRYPWNRQDIIVNKFVDGNFRVAFNWIW